MADPVTVGKGVAVANTAVGMAAGALDKITGRYKYKSGRKYVDEAQDILANPDLGLRLEGEQFRKLKNKTETLMKRRDELNEKTETFVGSIRNRNEATQFWKEAKMHRDVVKSESELARLAQLEKEKEERERAQVQSQGTAVTVGVVTSPASDDDGALPSAQEWTRRVGYSTAVDNFTQRNNHDGLPNAAFLTNDAIQTNYSSFQSNSVFSDNRNFHDSSRGYSKAATHTQSLTSANLLRSHPIVYDGQVIDNAGAHSLAHWDTTVVGNSERARDREVASTSYPQTAGGLIQFPSTTIVPANLDKSLPRGVQMRNPHASVNADFRSQGQLGTENSLAGDRNQHLREPMRGAQNLSQGMARLQADRPTNPQATVTSSARFLIGDRPIVSAQFVTEPLHGLGVDSSPSQGPSYRPNSPYYDAYNAIASTSSWVPTPVMPHDAQPGVGENGRSNTEWSIESLVATTEDERNRHFREPIREFRRGDPAYDMGNDRPRGAGVRVRVVYEYNSAQPRED